MLNLELLLLLLDLPDLLDLHSLVLQAGTRPATPRGTMGSNLAGQPVASHQSCFLSVSVDVVHVVLFVGNCATVIL